MTWSLKKRAFEFIVYFEWTNGLAEKTHLLYFWNIFIKKNLSGQILIKFFSHKLIASPYSTHIAKKKSKWKNQVFARGRGRNQNVTFWIDPDFLVKNMQCIHEEDVKVFPVPFKSTAEKNIEYSLGYPAPDCYSSLYMFFIIRTTHCVYVCFVAIVNDLSIYIVCE